MLYYLFDFLDKHFDIPGLGMFQYTSTRAGLAVLVALLIALFFGKKIINYLRREQLGETVRDLGLDGQKEKNGNAYYGWDYHHFGNGYSGFTVCQIGQYLHHHPFGFDCLVGCDWIFR